MMEPPDPVTVALAEAVTAGPEFVPVDLLDVVHTESDPIAALHDRDRANAIFAPMQRDLGFLPTGRVTRKPPSREEQDRLTGLVRWMIREFNDWTPAIDPQGRRLAALFTATVYCNRNGSFWPGFALRIRVNPTLVGELERRLGAFQFSISASGLGPTPISDAETIDRFNAADAAGDWVTIASDWPRLGDNLLLFPDAFVSQAVRYLHEFARDALGRALDRVRRTPPMMVLLSSLSVAESFTLAVASMNPYVRFGSVFRLFQQRRRHRTAMSPDEENLLAQLFIAVAANPTEWGQWMHALNRYPVRHPEIQKPLGRALAQGPDTALEPYVHAINLTTLGTGRDAISDCLRAFRAEAPPSHRRTLWSLAHERWARWNFAAAQNPEHLSKVSRCELDYAVVGYAVECMDFQERSRKYASLTAELLSLPTKWHASVTEFTSAANRILSVLQPYAFAGQIGPDEDWLIPQNSLMLPFDPQNDRYSTMLYKSNVT